MAQNNLTNSGKWLEKMLQEILVEYHTQGVCRLEKVEPPLRRIGRGQVIAMRNPFLDYTGTWTEAGGQSLHLEAKSTTDKHRLAICDPGGITENQFEALVKWHNAGAAVGVIWGRSEIDEIRLVSVMQLNECLAEGVKHVKWDAVAELPRGRGFRWDFMQALRSFYPFQTVQH